MTRKDFNLIAELINEAESLGIFTPKKKGMFTLLTMERLKETNTAFNEYAFKKATGLVK